MEYQRPASYSDDETRLRPVVLTGLALLVAVLGLLWAKWLPYTDRVLASFPIASRGPNGGYVLDGRGLFADNATLFFGGIGRPALRMRRSQKIRSTL